MTMFSGLIQSQKTRGGLVVVVDVDVAAGLGLRPNMESRWSAATTQLFTFSWSHTLAKSKLPQLHYRHSDLSLSCYLLWPRRCLQMQRKLSGPWLCLGKFKVSVQPADPDLRAPSLVLDIIVWARAEYWMSVGDFVIGHYWHTGMTDSWYGVIVKPLFIANSFWAV